MHSKQIWFFILFFHFASYSLLLYNFIVFHRRQRQASVFELILLHFLFIGFISISKLVFFSFLYNSSFCYTRFFSVSIVKVLFYSLITNRFSNLTTSFDYYFYCIQSFSSGSMEHCPFLVITHNFCKNCIQIYGTNLNATT